MNKYARIVVSPLFAAFVSIIAGCGEGGEPASSADETAAPTVAAEPALPTVEIDLDEFTIFMDARVPAGRVTLRLANQGFEQHNLAFFRVGSDSTVWETEGRLGPGERRTVTLDLEAGAYRAVCNYTDHEDRGMIVDFRAEEETPDRDGDDD